MKGGSLTRYDPHRGFPSSPCCRPSNQSGGLSMKGINPLQVIQSLPEQIKEKTTSTVKALPRRLKRKAVSAVSNNIKKTKTRTIRDIFA